MSAPESRTVPLTVELRREEVLHFLGYPDGHEPRATTARLIAEALPEARGLVRARGTYRRLPAERSPEAGLPPARAATVVLGLATVGGELERRATSLAESGDASRGLIFDAAASAAVEEAADRLCAAVLADAGVKPDRGDAQRLACRVSPGYGDWPLTAQPRVFGLVSHDEVGVRLLPSLLMVPRKSVSFAMWLDEDGRPVAGLSGCEHCLLERCAFRRGRR